MAYEVSTLPPMNLSSGHQDVVEHLESWRAGGWRLVSASHQTRTIYQEDLTEFYFFWERDEE